jgi:putative membrane protein
MYRRRVMRFLRALPAALATALSTVLHAVLSALGAAGAALGRGTAAAGRGAVALLPREWKKPIAALFVTGLALVPLIYSGNMTWSFSDPSNHLDRITAAVVNEDVGADATSADGEVTRLDVGAEFTETLLEKDQENLYRFVEVSPAEAERGLADGTYGATVAVPADFSERIASLGGDAAEAAPAMLTVTTNDSVNYVGGNFTKSVGTALTDALRGSVLEASRASTTGSSTPPTARASSPMVRASSTTAPASSWTARASSPTAPDSFATAPRGSHPVPPSCTPAASTWSSGWTS